MTAEEMIQSFVKAHQNRAETKAAFYANRSTETYNAYTAAVIVWDQAWKDLFDYKP